MRVEKDQPAQKSTLNRFFPALPAKVLATGGVFQLCLLVELARACMISNLMSAIEGDHQNRLALETTLKETHWP